MLPQIVAMLSKKWVRFPKGIVTSSLRGMPLFEIARVCNSRYCQSLCRSLSEVATKIESWVRSISPRTFSFNRSKTPKSPANSQSKYIEFLLFQSGCKS